MSIVYEARDLAAERFVALKMMQQEFYYGDQLRALLRAVAESVSRLRHPNVVQIYNYGERDGRPYFIMELLPGGSLDRRPAGREMPVGAAAALVRTLARTMNDVHREGIIHGNLKPSKVLLADDGTPKVTGFVVARHLRELGPKDPGVTMSGMAVMGTPRYMAPEQLSGNTAAIGPATDVYALGLILYELLTGWLPFRAATLWEMLNQVLHETPQPPRELRADVAPDLDMICRRCLLKKPEQRYRSAGVLADDLDRFLVGEPLLWEAAADKPLQVPIPRPDAVPTILTGPRGPLAAQTGVWARIARWFSSRPRKG
jgi:eukaryotic-like serine/threonine-protein kinase